MIENGKFVNGEGRHAELITPDEVEGEAKLCTNISYKSTFPTDFV